MDYKDLQKKAKELGLPYIGIPREELEKSIIELLGNKEKETSSDVVAEDAQLAEAKTKVSSKAKATTPAKEVSYNTAIVLDEEGREVRRYQKEVHGKNFIDLANEFASKKDYKIEFKNVEEGITCPNCSYVFNVS